MKTKQPMENTSVLLPRSYKEIWVAAAHSMGVSKSAFLRMALKEKARQVLRRERRDEIFSPARRENEKTM
jgi:hypothetical protein